MDHILKISEFLHWSNRVIMIAIVALFFLFYLPISFAVNEPTPLPERNDVIKHDQRPTDLEYALMSNYAYSRLYEGQSFLDLPNWKIYKIRTGAHAYYGMVFKNDVTSQLVLVHRGTVPYSVGNIIEDIQGIFKNELSLQKQEAYIFTQEMIKEAQKEGYNLSFTGHSLGAFLAELSVFFCHNNNYPKVYAVTFESPGSRETIEVLQSNIKERRVPIKELDIIGYVGNPNVINALNHHIGSLYQIEPGLGRYGWLPGVYVKQCHSMGNFVKYFKNNYKDSIHLPYYVSDWPVSDWSLRRFFKGSPQVTAYFEYVGWDKESNSYRYRLGSDKDAFILTYKGHYQVEKYNPKLTLPLIHFSPEMQSFLIRFHEMFWGMSKDGNDRDELLKEWAKAGIPKRITGCLINFMLVKSRDGSIIVNIGDDIQDRTEGWKNPLNEKTKFSICQFRSELSKYLQDNQGKIKELLSSVGKNENRLEIETTLVESGAEVDKIINGSVTGIDVSIHNIEDERFIKARREQQVQLIKELEDTQLKIKVVGVGKGAKVRELNNVIVKAVDFSVNKIGT